jgi:hypothetical protein
MLEGTRFCISGMFNFVPLPVIMSPGFWSAAHGPSHFAEIVMALLTPPSLCEVTFIVAAVREPDYHRLHLHYGRQAFDIARGNYGPPV